MSEKIYALLLRLHPSRFREAYGDEALQLFRDRARDEKGFLRGLQLWLDLLADLAISVPREYRYIQPHLIVAPAQKHMDGAPSFRVLGGESPPRGALLSGGLLSLITLAAFAVSISQVSNYRPPRAQALEPVRSASERWSASSRPAPQPASTATRSGSSDTQGVSGLTQPPDQHHNPQGATRATTQAVVESVQLDASERQRVILAVIANLKQHYLDPAVVQRMADALLAHQKSGQYNAVTDGPAFAGLVTRQLRDVSQDVHLDIVYSEAPLPDRPPGLTPEGRARYRKALEQENCTFEKVEILPHNIGYLKLNAFPDVTICQPTATAAMASLNRADAIIFDLRENRGGYASMVKFIASYLFDHPEYLYNPRENTTQESWTRSPVPGSRLADKPVYVLTSAITASGAEVFCYDLKMLKRATLVGEITRGAAHAAVFYRIDEHFGMGIPETKPINPFSSRDWEGTGVEPDVKVNAADALETARKLASGKRVK